MFMFWKVSGVYISSKEVVKKQIDIERMKKHIREMEKYGTVMGRPFYQGNGPVGI